MPKALHRLGFQMATGVRIQLEWTKGRGATTETIGMPSEVCLVEAEQEPDASAALGIPALCYRNDAPALFERLQLREETDYFLDVTVPVALSEVVEKIAGNPVWPFAARLATVFRPDPVRRWTSDSAGTTISGVLQLRSHAGVLDLSTVFGDVLRFEVVCQKLDYFEEFQALLDQVADELVELLLQYDSPVSANFSLSEAPAGNEAALLFHLRSIMSPENLPGSIDEVLGRLHSALYTVRTTQSVWDVTEPDVESLASEVDSLQLSAGGPLSRFFRGYTPNEVPVREQFETTDTAENRYVKYFLQEILFLCARLHDHFAAARRFASVAEVSGWIEQLEEMLGRPAWRDIGTFVRFPSNSQVLQKGRGYRDVLKYETTLRLALELPWARASEFSDGLVGDLRPVSELYEYWCFFMLRNALKDAGFVEQPREGTLVQISKEGFQVRLRKGQRSKISFRQSLPSGQVTANLYYNRKFRRPNKPQSLWLGSYTAAFHPDFSIDLRIQTDHNVRQHWLHFDAKYRMERSDARQMFQEPDAEKSDEGYEGELRRVYKQDDLFKMHTYRDGILGTRGAYILYPGDDINLSWTGAEQNIFVRHPSGFGTTPSHYVPSVGAFSMSPAKRDVQIGVVATLLLNVVSSLALTSGYTEETGPS